MVPTPHPSRRDVLAAAGTGFGLLALADLLAAEEKKTAAEPDRAAHPTIRRSIDALDAPTGGPYEQPPQDVSRE